MAIFNDVGSIGEKSVISTKCRVRRPLPLLNKEAIKLIEHSNAEPSEKNVSFFTMY